MTKKFPKVNITRTLIVSVTSMNKELVQSVGYPYFDFEKQKF